MFTKILSSNLEIIIFCKKETISHRTVFASQNRTGKPIGNRPPTPPLPSVLTPTQGKVHRFATHQSIAIKFGTNMGLKEKMYFLRRSRLSHLPYYNFVGRTARVRFVINRPTCAYFIYLQFQFYTLYHWNFLTNHPILKSVWKLSVKFPPSSVQPLRTGSISKTFKEENYLARYS